LEALAAPAPRRARRTPAAPLRTHARAAGVVSVRTHRRCRLRTRHAPRTPRRRRRIARRMLVSAPRRVHPTPVRTARVLRAAARAAA
jgi:hypothetical protein